MEKLNWTQLTQEAKRLQQKQMHLKPSILPSVENLVRPVLPSIAPHNIPIFILFHAKLLIILDPIIKNLKTTCYSKVEIPYRLTESLEGIGSLFSLNESPKLPATAIDPNYSMDDSFSSSTLTKLLLFATSIESYSPKDSKTILLKTLLTCIGGLNPNASQAPPDNPETPLKLAIRLAHIRHSTKAVELLLAHPLIDINKADQNNRTPLYHAIEAKNNSIISLLLQNPLIDKSPREITDFSEKKILWNPLELIKEVKDPTSNKVTYQVKLAAVPPAENVFFGSCSDHPYNVHGKRFYPERSESLYSSYYERTFISSGVQSCTGCTLTTLSPGLVIPSASAYILTQTSPNSFTIGLPPPPLNPFQQ